MLMGNKVVCVQHISTMSKENSRGRVVRFADVQTLERRIAAESPRPGEYFYDYRLEEAEREMTKLDEQEFHSKFKINLADLPISAATLKGLNNRGFTKMTEVQRCAIPHALADRDVLVSSRTGSGKTLAYLVPLIEKLYRRRFIGMDGLGAVVVVPVRELAMQVFEVLNSFSEKLELNVGLIIGGKDFKYESERIAYMNIIVCTPGRLLHHLEQTYGFQTSNLQMLVLDEADVMLQMGFREPLKAILEYLPKVQTLLFSATMTRDIYALSSLCTSQPEKILLQGVSARQEEQLSETLRGAYETPAKLTQYYMSVATDEKINTFYSFLKSHHKQKVVVFLSTCKQVRFLYEALRKFRLGCPLYELQGHQKQKKRMAIYFTFCEKRYGVLLCTNIAARGLDFPLVDWVVQFDIPDQIDTYVHRVGRTARYKAEGRSLVFVSEHERLFVQQLHKKGINLHKISQNPQRYLRIQSSLQSICSEHQDVKYLAQRAIISYIRFVFKAHSKDIFNIKKINLELLAKSYGLATAPQIMGKVPQPNSESEQQEEGEQKPKLTKIQQLRLKQKMKKLEKKKPASNEQPVQWEQAQQKQRQQEAQQQNQDEAQQQNQDDFLKIKGKVSANGERAPLSVSKRQLKRIKPQGHFQGKNKVFFDSDGHTISADEHRKLQRLQANRQEVEYNPIQHIQQRIDKNRQVDDTVEKERRKVQRKKRETARQINRRGERVEINRRGERVEAVLASDNQEFDE